jgi:hypothetical protein
MFLAAGGGGRRLRVVLGCHRCRRPACQDGRARACPGRRNDARPPGVMVFIQERVNKRSFAMRHQRKERMATPAPREKVATDLPTSGYALVVDGHAKSGFATNDQALKAARDLKGRFPMLQIKIYDAERKRSEKIELAAA